MGGDENFLKQLEEMNMTIDKLKVQVGEELLRQGYLAKLHEDIEPVSELELRAEFTKAKKEEKAKARHILFLTDKKTDSEKKNIYKRMQGILKRARSGEDFAKLAEQFSEGPSAKGGGDLGYFGRGDMVKQFDEAAFSLPVGEISDIVETQFGYHIIKVEDRKSDSRNYEEMKDDISQKMQTQRKNDLFTKKMDELRLDAEVAISVF